MNLLNKRLKLLNKHSSPSSAAYSDRTNSKISTLVSYKFNRVGGGRELEYANWNNKAIETIDEKSFYEIIEDIKMTKILFKKTKNMSLVEFLNMFPS